MGVERVYLASGECCGGETDGPMGGRGWQFGGGHFGCGQATAQWGGEAREVFRDHCEDERRRRQKRKRAALSSVHRQLIRRVSRASAYPFRQGGPLRPLAPAST